MTTSCRLVISRGCPQEKKSSFDHKINPFSLVWVHTKAKNSAVIMPWKAKKGNWDLSFFWTGKIESSNSESHCLLSCCSFDCGQWTKKKGNLTSTIVRQWNWSYGFLTVNRERCIVSTGASVPLQRCGSLWA